MGKGGLSRADNQICFFYSGMIIRFGELGCTHLNAYMHGQVTVTELGIAHLHTFFGAQGVALFSNFGCASSQIGVQVVKMGEQVE